MVDRASLSLACCAHLPFCLTRSLLLHPYPSVFFNLPCVVAVFVACLILVYSCHHFTMTRTVRIGVLSIQGAFSEHVASLQKLSKELKSQSSDIVVEGVQVRTASQISLDHLDGLIIPGGESTTMALVATRLGLWDALVQWTRSGNPTWVSVQGRAWRRQW